MSLEKEIREIQIISSLLIVCMVVFIFTFYNIAKLPNDDMALRDNVNVISMADVTSITKKVWWISFVATNPVAGIPTLVLSGLK